jgi:glycosyltransferase involved in cell wall biosynthesis
VNRHSVTEVIVLYPCEVHWPLLLLHSLTRFRLITICQGNDILTYEEKCALERWLLRRTLRASHAIIAAADHLVRKAQRITSPTTPPIHLIPNPVDLTHFRPKPADRPRLDPRPTLVHVSNFNPKKRVTDIIQAFALARLGHDARLVMVGDGPDLAEAKRLASELRVDRRVTFVGAQRDVRQYLWEADLLVMASDEESGPLALLEAMACGVPWIATRWGIAGMLPEAACGLLIPARSPANLAKAITTLMDDPPRRQTMGLAGARLARDFSDDVYIRRHIALLALADTRG